MSEPTHATRTHEVPDSRSDHGYAARNGSAEEQEAFWTERTRIFLNPVAAPSILGLFGFMGATVMVAAWMAGWYGTPATPFTLWPFALTFGGFAQLLAGMWSYKARDGVATAMHGLWGSFWLAFGVITLLAETGVAPPLLLGTNVDFAGSSCWRRSR
jgi:succinate-acetate transporter protein